MILTSGGMELLRNYLGAGRNDLAPHPPQYVVFGSGTQPVSRFMSTIPGETFRSPILARSLEGLSVIYSTFLGAADNQNQTIGTYGIVGGDASLASGSGTLLAVANEATPFGKSGTDGYAVDLVLTVSGTIS